MAYKYDYWANIIRHENHWMEKFIHIGLGYKTAENGKLIRPLRVTIQETSSHRDLTHRRDEWELETIGM